MIKYTFIYILFFACLLDIKAQELSVGFSKTNKECELGKANIIIHSAALPYNVLWSDGSIMNEHENLEQGEYWVKVTDDQNNDTTIYFRIDEIACEPVPQNHFTPNEDGYYDTWSIGGLQYFPTFELFVYNRWGQQVHHQADLYFPWDGKNLGLPLPDGAYFYIIYLSRSDKNKFIKGDVNILR